MTPAGDHIAVTRPELTFPDAEGRLVRAEYERASVILEYGSGGSTVMAAEMPGKRITSVESDGAWARMMRAWFDANPPVSPVKIVHHDIGPTKEWGHPETDEGWRKYPGYPLKVWETADFVQPDVVLVDGRFRVGCALATAFRTKKPVVVLFDDYVERTQYHGVEEFIGRPEFTGRLARFEVSPMAVPADRLLRVVQFLSRP
ncbi:hypothetical protein ATO6_16865 [Oceanicola sp. 22II-s10i]|uniref:hypothetical protein n=1 Tax=Oceanicola sp. 22II-s10i TaxID=1317116 RepID=UPI000B527C38|nr:hypothetical protein [Oceanicola sp. 22II-s10i]OWU83553.1 hypothetical protein ATO6_16865 [Oceanicola sp. 22II-s10i]